MALPTVALAAPEYDEAADGRLVELAPPAQPEPSGGRAGDIVSDAGLAKAPRNERATPGDFVVGGAQACRLLIADDPRIVLRATDLLLAQLGGGLSVLLGRHGGPPKEKSPRKAGSVERWFSADGRRECLRENIIRGSVGLYRHPLKNIM